MSRHEPTRREMMARRDRQVRLVQAICGAAAGAVALSLFLGAVGAVVGAIAGAVAGYATPLWRSGLD